MQIMSMKVQKRQTGENWTERCGAFIVRKCEE